MTRWPAVFAAAFFLVISGSAVPAGDRLRVATFDAELRRDGPGLLLRDILRGEDRQVLAAVQVIAAAKPDILALISFDWDYDNRALDAFAEELKAAGADFPYRFSARPNNGLATDLDLDGDGRLGGPGDAQGYGDFTGQGGLAILSRFPIREDRIQDFSDLPWREFPNALLPEHPDGTPFPSAEAQAVQRLSSSGHWSVPIALPGGSTLTLMTFHAAPPVFDGPEDRNGRRNHDEVLFWQHYLDGAFGPAPEEHFVLTGGANLDPVASAGRTEAIRALLNDPRLIDTQPRSAGGAELDDATDTVDWSGVGAGVMRVDYVLPSSDWTILGSGVFWPGLEDTLNATATMASRHRLVWVDLVAPQPD